MKLIHLLALAALLPAAVPGAETIWEDSFTNGPATGWTWRREDPAGWRASPAGLEVRVQPGNMWGPGNNARNVLVRPVPDPGAGEVEVVVTITNRPTSQYEQVDLVWYYDDSNMVKIGQELVDGQLSIVMGREQADRTRTIAIIPLDSFTVSVRLLVKGDRLRGQFRNPGDAAWRDAGECDLPVKGSPNISLQFYQGSPQMEHWARVSNFRLAQKPGP